MVANGDKAKHVWLTELGWSTATTTYGVTEAAQADHLTKAFTELTTYPVRGRRVLAQLPQHLVVTGRSASLDANDGLPRTDFSESRPTPPSRRPPDDCRHRPSSVGGSHDSERPRP